MSSTRNTRRIRYVSTIVLLCQHGDSATALYSVTPSVSQNSGTGSAIFCDCHCQCHVQKSNPFMIRSM